MIDLRLDLGVFTFYFYSHILFFLFKKRRWYYKCLLKKKKGKFVHHTCKFTSHKLIAHTWYCIQTLYKCGQSETSYNA